MEQQRQPGDDLLKHWAVTELRLSSNERPEILQDILHITFDRLQILHLSFNAIHSVEHLHSLRMPAIRIIYLSANNLTTVAPSRKAAWPRLSKLILCKNYIVDYGKLVEAHWPLLGTLWLWDKDFHKKDTLVIPCFIAKLPMPWLQPKFCTKKQFLSERPLKEILDRKWEQNK